MSKTESRCLNSWFEQVNKKHQTIAHWKRKTKFRGKYCKINFTGTLQRKFVNNCIFLVNAPQRSVLRHRRRHSIRGHCYEKLRHRLRWWRGVLAKLLHRQQPPWADCLESCNDNMCWEQKKIFFECDMATKNINHCWHFNNRYEQTSDLRQRS